MLIVFWPLALFENMNINVKNVISSLFFLTSVFFSFVFIKERRVEAEEDQNSAVVLSAALSADGHDRWNWRACDCIAARQANYTAATATARCLKESKNTICTYAECDA